MAALLLLGSCSSPAEGIRYCAVYETISCYGNPGVSEAICDDACALMPGTSSYDPRTECLTEYGPAHGAGTSCEQAIEDLEKHAALPLDHCAPSDDDPICKVCAKQFCCSSFAACQDASSCLAVGLCLDRCGGNDDACVSDCYADYPDGAPLLDAYYACLDESCVEACSR